MNVGGHDKVKIKCKIGVPNSVGDSLPGLVALMGTSQFEAAVWAGNMTHTVCVFFAENGGH